MQAGCCGWPQAAGENQVLAGDPLEAARCSDEQETVFPAQGRLTQPQLNVLPDGGGGELPNAGIGPAGRATGDRNPVQQYHRGLPGNLSGETQAAGPGPDHEERRCHREPTVPRLVCRTLAGPVPVCSAVMKEIPAVHSEPWQRP